MFLFITSITPLILLELLNKKKIEVLLLTEPIDPFLVQNLTEYGGKSLVSASKELVLEESKENKFNKSFAPLCDHIKSILGDRIEKTIVSTDLLIRLLLWLLAHLDGQLEWSKL